MPEPLPAKTPDEIARTLNVAINEILKDPEVASRLEQLGFEPLSLDQKAADTMFRSDIVKWRSMVEAINLKPDGAASKHRYWPLATCVVAPHISASDQRGQHLFPSSSHVATISV